MKLKSKHDGFEFEAYHAAPTDARRGGLVLIQEIFGVTAGIRELASRIAADLPQKAQSLMSIMERTSAD
jgi:carboxymethylenebutenolidase